MTSDNKEDLMPDNFLSPMWDRVTRWFDSNAQHVTVEFIPEPGAAPVAADGGYLRISVAEGFLAKAATWGNQHFPVLHGGAALTFLGGATPFTTFARPPGSWNVPGAQMDVQLTPLLPFSGGVVEIEAALYQATVTGPLFTAVQLMSSLSSLLAPPLAVAATIAGKVADGLNTVLGAEQPVLGVHYAMVSAGGSGHILQPGVLAVVARPRDKMPGRLSMAPGGLCLDNGSGPRQLSGVDYLVIRVECRAERDDWRFPELDQLILSAGTAYLKGKTAVFEDLRTEAVTRAWTSPDLIPSDRVRVAKLVTDQINQVRDLKAVPGAEQSLEEIARDRLPAPDAPELANLTLRGLLGF
jgi:hypothetical protein